MYHIIYAQSIVFRCIIYFIQTVLFFLYPTCSDICCRKLMKIFSIYFMSNVSCIFRPPRPTQNSSAGNNRFQRTCCGDRDDLKMHGDALKEIRRECFAEIRRNRAAKAVDSEPFDMFNCRKVGKSKDDLVVSFPKFINSINSINSMGNF